jgi:hypothetical protein
VNVTAAAGNLEIYQGRSRVGRSSARQDRRVWCGSGHSSSSPPFHEGESELRRRRHQRALAGHQLGAEGCQPGLRTIDTGHYLSVLSHPGGCPILSRCQWRDPAGYCHETLAGSFRRRANPFTQVTEPSEAL